MPDLLLIVLAVRSGGAGQDSARLVVLAFLKSLKIVPAELVVALLAVNVIATTILDDHYATLRAMLPTFLLLPHLKPGLILILATDVHL